MTDEDSRSKSPRRPPAAGLISTRLAPGFRFHPTDEELVSYYLKRKVRGQPIRVNPISEVDLYRAEPWDLPPHSRLHSRDLEWYFFTALDRKYSNRSRTNRATEEGYWKTTGKDRPVRRRSLTIGMKKTLVYHAGRAPRGQRTNWVMHEYRLEDDDSSHSGVSQDGYVLCRIFQKSGPGPQNGAQYGAPYEEDEWERYEDESANVVVPGNGVFVSPEDYVHLDDFLEDQDEGIQHSNAVPLVANPTEQDIGSNTEDPSSPMEKILKDESSVDDFSVYVNYPALQENTPILNGPWENSSVEDRSSYKIFGYVQLNDIAENTCFKSDVYLNDGPSGEHVDISVFDVEGNSDLLANCVNGQLLDTTGVSSLPDQPQICRVQYDMQVEPYNSAQLAEDNLTYYDALGSDVQYLENSFPNESSSMPRNRYDFLEELMAYYDATDDTLHYATTDYFVSELSSSTEAAGSCTSSGAVSAVENVAEFGSLISKSNISSTLGGSTKKLSADILQKDPEAKTLMNRLAGLLESISAPPAFAAERTAITETPGRISAVSTSSFLAAARMIHIQNSTVDLGCSEGWTLPKNRMPGILFSCALGGDVSNLVLREPLKCGVFSSFFQGGLRSLVASALMLALSYRVGVLVFNYCL